MTEPAWLGRALDDAAARIARAPASTDVLLAELATGRYERARAMLQAPAPDPLVAARYAAWTGDLHPLAAAWEALRAAALALLADETAPRRARVCAELERTATDLGDARLAADLHRCARAGDTTAPGDAPPGSDAAMMLDIVHDLIGAHPDAARHRLRLRPRLDGGRPRLQFRNLAFAGGSVRLDAACDAESITCRVEQDAGAIPVTLLLEPRVSGHPAAAFVDGRPAQLDVKSLPDGTIVPVQLVLDHERTLQIRLAPQSKEPPTGGVGGSHML